MTETTIQSTASGAICVLIVTPIPGIGSTLPLIDAVLSSVNRNSESREDRQVQEICRLRAALRFSRRQILGHSVTPIPASKVCFSVNRNSESRWGGQVQEICRLRALDRFGRCQTVGHSVTSIPVAKAWSPALTVTSSPAGAGKFRKSVGSALQSGSAGARSWGIV